MKRLWLVAILMLLSAGCGGSAAPGGGGQCNRGLCIQIEVAEPIRWGEPITVTISTTTDKDIFDLGISVFVHPYKGVIVEGPEGWEKEAQGGAVFEGGAGWKVNIKANQPVAFTRKLRLPPREGIFEIMGSATTKQGLRVANSVRIHLTHEGGVVNPTPAVLPGTPALVPTVPPEWLLTPFPTPTPWPTPFPTPTSPPPVRTPTPTQPAFISPLPTPTSAAYP